MKVAPIELQRPLIIVLHTVQRQGDILRLPWSAYDGTAITLRRGKSARGGPFLARRAEVPGQKRKKQWLTRGWVARPKGNGVQAS